MYGVASLFIGILARLGGEKEGNEEEKESSAHASISWAHISCFVLPICGQAQQEIGSS